jgi:hypothetical protein
MPGVGLQNIARIGIKPAWIEKHMRTRKAEKYEARYYFEVAKDHFRKGR